MNKISPDVSLRLAAAVSAKAESEFQQGTLLEKVTPVTADLLRFWFCEPFTMMRSHNFHEGQRQAILNIIYLHEVLQVKTVADIYERAAPELMAETDMEALAKEKYCLPKYAVKMATGTGKTWVMHALVIWQMLNARHEEKCSGRFVRHFLIVAPGLVVYDRLLDAYLGRMKLGTSERDMETSDLFLNQEVFIPQAYREEVFNFLRSNVVSKEQGIGIKATGEGLIALTNWHLFLTAEDESEAIDADAPNTIVSDLLPVRPGLTSGNALDMLDRRALRGTELEYLAALPELMVINDEAHHIHENRVAGEVQEVEWQRGLNYIAQGKAGHLFQLDFSATPYDTYGSGKRRTKVYFPHIVINYDLKKAICSGLVKTILLDRRQELTEIENLDYRAERDESGKVIGLSDGQRLMLRAGIQKLNLLEEGFVAVDASKHPKMLVMCEDTAVVPFVESFLLAEGLSSEDVLSIDSNKKGELKDAEWLRVKERLFNVDRYEHPRIIVSVLMLREGFDVNNICVIVPLRSTESSILLEQTIGRGLRLMWREPAYTDEKRENRRRVLVRKEPPHSYIDMLSVIEHPRFQAFYEDLMSEGLMGADDNDLEDGVTPVGDLMKVGLKADYTAYDLFWPLVIRDAEEELVVPTIDLQSLSPFTAFSLEKLRRFLGVEGETFVSQEVTAQTQFGRYQVKADLFSAKNYNEYLQKMLRTVTTRMDRVGVRKTKFLPSLQINQMEIVRLMDVYIRTRLFNGPFNPFADNDWKILLTKNGIVTEHIVCEMSLAIHRMQESVETHDALVEPMWFSQVREMVVRESYSLELQKTIYERTGYPSHGGGFERDFMDFIDHDGEVMAFLKINEAKHVFAQIFYIRKDGLLASYHPDFIIRTEGHIYIVETKGDDKVNDANVRQKQKATLEWCKKINLLSPENRMDCVWEYVLLSQANFYSLSQNGATLKDILNLSKVSASAVTGRLFD